MLPTTSKMLELEIMKMKVSSQTPPTNHASYRIHPSQETVAAYKEQNVFLSQEIVELNNLRGSDVNEKRKLEG